MGVTAILAGGASQRMGQDKASLQLPSGETVLARTARLAQHFGSVLVVGRPEPEGWSLPGIRFQPDDTPQEGPAAGLATALRHADTPALLVLSCDTPLLTLHALRWLRDATAAAELGAVQTPWHGCISVVEGRWQPLFGIYAHECLPLLEANLARGARSLKALLQAGNFTYADVPPDIAPALANINTPEDWNSIVPFLQVQAATDAASVENASTVSRISPRASTETG